MRFILRRTTGPGNPGPAARVAQQLAMSGVSVLSTEPQALLVDGERSLIEKILKGSGEWLIVESQRYSLPDARPAILDHA